jgi:Sulfotransferase family
MGPDFLYIGCQKAGSGWLYDQLKAHASFWMPPIKELHYFDGYEGGAVRGIAARQAEARRKRKKKGLLKGLLPRMKRRRPKAPSAAFIDQVVAGDGGRLDLDWYASLFQWKGDRLSGDITPAYSTLSPAMIGAVTARFPDLRCILFVRDPVARVWSHVCHALLRRQGMLPKDWPELASFLSTDAVAARSYPSRIFARWREHVPAERIFVGFFDQLTAEPDVLRADVLRFLGAEPSPPAIAAGFDRKRDQRRAACPPEMQRRLADWFADELQACATVFGGPASTWPRRYGLTAAEA